MKTFMKIVGVVLGLVVIIIPYLQSIKDEPPPELPAMVTTTQAESSLLQADYRQEKK